MGDYGKAVEVRHGEDSLVPEGGAYWTVDLVLLDRGSNSDLPVKPVMVKTTMINKIPSTGPEKADRYRFPVWYSSHVVK